MRNLLQRSVRDFSISIVKNIPQNNYWNVLWKKNKQNQGHSVEKEQYKMGKTTYINA